MMSEPGGESTPSDQRLRARYSRQILYKHIGLKGQRQLAAARVTIFGIGALGSMLADTLARAGVGYLRLIDRDFIERNNLQRQVLFDEDDIAAGLPKAEAAAARLARINPDIALEPVVAHADCDNIERLAEGADLLLDGTDNFETRFLINDLAIKTARPWIYGGVIEGHGRLMVVMPGKTPCLRCLFNQAPPPDSTETCDTVGVIAPAVHLVASLQAVEAIKLLTGQSASCEKRFLAIDAWSARLGGIKTSSLLRADCPCCGRRQFDYLDGGAGRGTTTLCGRNAVQVTPRSSQPLDLPVFAERLAAAGNLTSHNRFLLRATLDDLELTLFRDGRAIIKGTDDSARARTLYDKYVGS